MFDPVLIFASLLHAALLAALPYWYCRRAKVPVKDWPFVIALLVWGGLVLGGHAASALHGLNTLTIYAPSSLLGVGLMVMIFRSVWRLPAGAALVSAPGLSIATIKSPKTSKILWRFLLISLAAFALASIVLGMSVYPDNADSMIYRLPRAVWYSSSGTLFHPFKSPDNRLVYYPLDGILLYIPLVLYKLPGTFHSIPSLISWVMVVFAVYRFSRELGADRLISLFSAWLVGMTPSILAQATSTNDEILAAAVFLCGLLMGWRWLATGRHGYFLLAGLSVSLSAGTKLHIVFLMPIISVAFLILVWRLYKNPSLLRQWGGAIGTKTAVVTLLLMVVMFAPFLLYNYLSIGRVYFFDDFKKEVFNLGASLQVGFQNLLIYGSQMVLSPIADLNFWPVANDRQRFNTALNQIFNPLIKPLIDENPNYFHLGYRFVGITIPVSVRFVEFSLWSAFIWLLWPLQAAVAWRQRACALRPLLFLLAITPPFWLVFWSFSTLYMEGTATYFTFYLVCAAPAALLTFGAIRRAWVNELRWVVVAVVTLSNLVICHNLVMYSGFRALPDLVYSKTWPYDWLLTEKPIIDEIRASDRTRIVMTHEKMPYFGYMHWNPSATYYTPFDLKDEKEIPDLQNVLQVLPISGLNMYGFMVFQIPEKLTPGPTYLGAVRAIGREAIFATGNNVHLRHPDQSNYIVMQAKIEPVAGGKWQIGLSNTPIGFSRDDQLTFEYLLSSGRQNLFHRKEDRSPGFAVTMDNNPHEFKIELTTIIRSAWNGKELTRATYQIGGPGMWLPEGAEY